MFTVSNTSVLLKVDPRPDTGGERYEIARKAGLSHETAADTVAPAPLQGRRISGRDWEPSAAQPTTERRYDGRPVTIDAMLWARKTAHSCCAVLGNPWCRAIGAIFDHFGEVAPVNARLRVTDKSVDNPHGTGVETDGCFRIDFQVPSRVSITRKMTVTRLVPVEVCDAHDLRRFVDICLQNNSSAVRELVATTLLRETDLQHVNG